MTRTQAGGGRTLNQRLSDAYNGLQDYGALAGRTADSYENERQQINDPANTADPFKAMHISQNLSNAVAPMSPWLQAEQDAAGPKATINPNGPGLPGQHGLPTTLKNPADSAAWWMQNTGPYAPNANSLPASLRALSN